MAAHRIFQDVVEKTFVGRLASEFNRFPFQVPILLLTNPVAIYDQVMTWFKRVDIPVDRFRTGNVEIGENVRNGRCV